jgi:hypothetical protein
MSQSITTTVSVNGWLNLGTQARTDGYIGEAILKEGTVLNLNATVAYLHITSSGSAAPATANKGIGIGTTSSTAASSFFTLPRGTDINCLWINTSGAQTINYSFTGI